MSALGCLRLTTSRFKGRETAHLEFQPAELLISCLLLITYYILTTIYYVVSIKYYIWPFITAHSRALIYRSVNRQAALVILFPLRRLVVTVVHPNPMRAIPLPAEVNNSSS